MMLQKKTKKSIIQIDYKLIAKSSAQIINISSGSGKISSFFNFMRHQSDIEQIYVYAKGPHDAKH